MNTFTFYDKATNIFKRFFVYKVYHSSKCILQDDKKP